jgi:hypothetical protein
MMHASTLWKVLAVAYSLWLWYYASIHILIWETHAAKWLKNPRVYNSVGRIIRSGPAFFAYDLMGAVQRTQDHTSEPNCLPCIVIERMNSNKHKETEGPHSLYCSKCGLAKKDWKPLCRNKVVKVNNPKRRARWKPIQAFWD